MNIKLKNTVYLSLVNVYVKSIGLLIIPLMAKTFTVEIFGIYIISQTLFNYFRNFSDMGVKRTGIRELNADISEAEKENLIQQIVSIRFLIVLGCFCLMNVAGFFLFGLGQNLALVFLFSLGLLALVLNITWIYDAQQKMYIQSIYKVLERTIFLCLAVLGILIKNVYFVALAGFFSASFAGYFAVKKWFDFKKIKIIKDLACWPLIKESLPIGFTSLIASLYLTIDQFMIKAMLGNKSLGLYGGIEKIVIALISFGWILGYVIYPEFSRLYLRKNFKKIKKLSFFMTGLLFFAYLIVYVLFKIFSQKIIVFILSAEYLVVEPVLNVLMIMFFFYLLNIVFSDSLNAFRKQRYRLVIAIIGLLVNVSLNLFLIKHYQIIGAAYATLITQIAVFVMSLFVFFAVLRGDNESNVE